MDSFFFVATLALCGTMPFYLYRIIRGPDLFDRLIGLNGISTKSILFLLLLGGLFHNLEMLIDIGLGFGLMNLVSAVAVGKYLERKEPRT